MDIAQFELVFKPQSPTGPADTVLQGFFLNISNLEDVDLDVRVDLVTSSISDPDRSLANNCIAIIDGPNQNNVSASVIGALTSKSFRVSPFVNVPAHGTSKIVVLPSDPFAMPGATPDFEARGYVTLRLPPRLRFTGQFLTFERQIEGEARLLVTPQNRATYLDTAGAISDQTQSSVPTAEGGARVEIPSEGFPFFDRVIPERLPELIAELPEDRIEDLALADLGLMLGALAQSEMDLKALNAALKEAGIGMAVETRKV